MLRALKSELSIFFLLSFTTIHCANIGYQRVIALLAIEMPGTSLVESAEPQKFVEGPVVLVQCVGRANSGAFCRGALPVHLSPCLPDLT